MKKLGLNSESEYRKRFLRIEKMANSLKAMQEKSQIFIESVEGDRIAKFNYLDEKVVLLTPRAHTLVAQLSELTHWHERVVSDDDFAKLMHYAEIHVRESRLIHDAVKADVSLKPIRARHFDHHARGRLPILKAAMEMFKSRAFARGI